MSATPDDSFVGLPPADRRRLDLLDATPHRVAPAGAPRSCSSTAAPSLRHAAHGFEAQAPDADARRAVDDPMA